MRVACSINCVRVLYTTHSCSDNNRHLKCTKQLAVASARSSLMVTPSENVHQITHPDNAESSLGLRTRKDRLGRQVREERPFRTDSVLRVDEAAQDPGAGAALDSLFFLAV